MTTQPYRRAFLTNIDGIATKGSTYNLGDFEIGIFDYKNYQAVTNPSYPTNNAIIIAQGTDSRTFPKGVALTNETKKMPPMFAKNITSWVANKAEKPQNMIVRMGFDGVDTTKTLKVREGKYMTFYLSLSGAPIGNLLGASSTTHYQTLTEAFTIELPCSDDCVDSCGALIDCNIIADAAIKAVNERKIIGGGLLSKYVKASKITSCTTPSGYPTVDYTKWTLTVCDLGNQVALGKVQAQYPEYTVSRVSREGVYSTYEMVIITGTTPSDFDTSVTPIIPNCATCPSGYTLVSDMYAYTVTRTDTGNAAALSTFNTDYSSTTAIRLSYALGTSTYEVYNTSSTLSPVTPGDVVTSIGTSQSICVLDTPTSTPWTEGSTCTKAKKKYSLSLKNDACGAGFLAQLQEAYAGIGIVTQEATNTDTCTTLYVIEIESDNIFCEDCTDASYSFTKPQSFNGSIWAEVPMDITGEDCVCGVQFESAYVSRDRKECFFEAVSYEVEPLFIQVSSRNPEDIDPSALCEENFPVTVVQGVKYAKGYGSSVLAERVKLSNFYFNRHWKTDPAERDAMGYELGIDLQGYYDEFVITYTVPLENIGMAAGFGHSQYEEYSLAVYYPAGQGRDFMNAINSFVTFPGSIISPVSI